LVICPQSAEADLPSELRQHFREIKLLEVCHYKPQNRIEFKDWGDAWPVIYRPTELSEERARGLPTSEIEILRNHLSSLTTDRDAIIVDPITNEVNDFSPSSLLLTILQVLVCPDQVRSYLNSLPRHASRSITMNPLYSSSPTLLCIEGVASMVRGEFTAPSESLTGPCSASSARHLPISDQQYVCTGLDLYLLHEPDMMSAMALVHSRIRRVVYIHPDPLCGALGSTHSVHEMRSLNHRFRVYRANYHS
jgi:hypothetical protein